MSFIQPNSDVKLLHNVPLDTTQEHSIVFDNTSAQYNYFSSLAKFTFADYSYQRVNVGVIKVEKCADDIYDCNYLMFRNTSFGSKWFYAFITKIEYINNITSAVYYELDVLQSWLFDFDTEDCFVEREMPTTDYANEQLVPESLETGDYVLTDFKEYDDIMTPAKLCILVSNPIIYAGGLTDEYTVLTESVVADFKTKFGNPKTTTSFSLGIADASMSHCGSLPMGLMPILFNNTNVGRQNLNWYITYLTAHNNAESVRSMFLVPKFTSITYSVDFISGTTETAYHSARASVSTYTNDYVLSRIYGLGDHNKETIYKPQNMKLFNYPYSFPVISDGNGNMSSFKPELFTNKDDRFVFSIKYSLSSTGEILFVPKSYKGMNLNYNESFVFNKFPQVSWITDFFTEYWARNKVDITASILGDMLSGANGVANGQAQFVNSGGYIQPLSENYRNIQMGGQFGGNYKQQLNIAKGLNYSGAISSAISIGQTLGNVGIARQMSDKSRGQQSCDTLTSTGNLRVFSGVMSVTQEMAKVIDEYFTRFGYATHLNKVPNWRGNSRRPHWNYVRTIGCTIRGSLPQEDADTICSIFDNGITWWRNGNEIGNYSLDNRPSARGQFRP